jgi:hypothetical protein
MISLPKVSSSVLPAGVILVPDIRYGPLSSVFGTSKDTKTDVRIVRLSNRGGCHDDPEYTIVGTAWKVKGLNSSMGNGPARN